jgi:hypothetical protein
MYPCWKGLLPDHDGGFPSCGVIDNNTLQALKEKEQDGTHIIKLMAQSCCLLL